MGQEIDRASRLLEKAYGSGGMSEDSKDALVAIKDAALEIGRSLGDESSSHELLLATVLVDDSTSIATRIDDIRIGHKRLFKALAGETATADVQVMTRALNRGTLFPFRDLGSAPPLTVQNFSANRLVPETPLHLQSVLTLGTVLLKSYELEAKGVSVRTYTLIITDGDDNKSGSITAKHVQAMVADMTKFHANHIVAGMGIGEVEGIDYRQIFHAMGITKVYTAGTTPEELGAEFSKVAEDLRLAASSQDGFRQLAAGGSESGGA